MTRKKQLWNKHFYHCSKIYIQMKCKVCIPFNKEKKSPFLPRLEISFACWTVQLFHVISKSKVFCMRFKNIFSIFVFLKEDQRDAVFAVSGTTHTPALLKKKLRGFFCYMDLVLAFFIIFFSWRLHFTSSLFSQKRIL